MSYIDGFVCAVPTHRQAEYAEHADKAAQVFKQCGAIEVIEAWGMTFQMAHIRRFYRQ
ncbi:hypothetical protein PPRY_b0975 [Pseudoalteromonas prydzensis ACAM 620]|nr:hypothetical protein [Pseudoalteromonas prydzensis ACAM 620]